jgi:GxxExxY protein
LRQLGFKVEQKLRLPVVYKDVKLDCGYRLDLLVEDSVILNFHVSVLKDGSKRVVNEFPDSAFSATPAVKQSVQS